MFSTDPDKHPSTAQSSLIACSRRAQETEGREAGNDGKGGGHKYQNISCYRNQWWRPDGKVGVIGGAEQAGVNIDRRTTEFSPPDGTSGIVGGATTHRWSRAPR